MFGREACVPLDLLQSHDPHMDQTTLDVPHYVQNLQNTLTLAYAHMRQSVGGQQEHQQEFYNQRVHGILTSPEHWSGSTALWNLGVKLSSFCDVLEYGTYSCKGRGYVMNCLIMVLTGHNSSFLPFHQTSPYY